jgi:polysaccharide export outer membrane protein
VLPFCQAQNGTTETKWVDPDKTSSSKPSSAPADKVIVEEPLAATDSYVIGIADELTINVWREAELSQQVVVRPDGIITLPLLDEVRVAGLTPKQLQAKLIEKLKPYIAEPQVTIAVRAIHSRNIYLMGAVTRPGAYPLSSGKSVLEVLAEAGGLGPFSKPSAIYILRSNGDKRVKISFNYKKAIAGVPGSDPELKPDDMIVVP